MRGTLTRLYGLVYAICVTCVIVLVVVLDIAFVESGIFVWGTFDVLDWILLGAAIVVVALAVFAGWTLVRRRLLLPLLRLAEQSQNAIYSDADRPLEFPDDPTLGEIGEAVTSMAEALVAERRDVVRAMAAATDRLESQLRAAGSGVHIFGHTHIPWDETIEGVRYVQNPLAYPHERKRRRQDGIRLVEV